MRDEDVQAFHPCRHTADAGITWQPFDGITTCKVIAMRCFESGGQLWISVEPRRHLAHEAGSLEGADR